MKIQAPTARRALPEKGIQPRELMNLLYFDFKVPAVTITPFSVIKRLREIYALSPSLRRLQHRAPPLADACCQHISQILRAPRPTACLAPQQTWSTRFFAQCAAASVHVNSSPPQIAT